VVRGSLKREGPFEARPPSPELRLSVESCALSPQGGREGTCRGRAVQRCRENRSRAAYMALRNESPTGIGGRGSSPKILSFSGKNQDVSRATSGRSSSPPFPA